ncbi:PREDICTED: aluminum-activated malate transporter 10 [Theobroma cacao]|uniref:Aluminum-activated malate transporter 10 n=1 Tax=Theobroma cacao TaxID=3641 RepID=A0AB32VSC6_THECC|nr:PREDICTED: aluminum-activated malate transporter 10 [Theobroma cacao]
MAKEAAGKLEWRTNVPDETSKKLEPDYGLVGKTWLRLKCVMGGLVMKVWGFLEKVWNLGVAEPRKVIHCARVGLALSIVSLFYYIRPLYDDFGGNVMWAVMTVVVVFEYTVGATLSKCINRATGTILAGALGVGIHWVADRSGDKLKPIVLGVSVFFFASAATFSRFIPSVKARFDYGAMIFILTFSLVSVSAYRMVELFELAQDRLSTVAIGASLCILVTMLFCPIWAGCELHRLIHQNMEKLVDSLDGCVAHYFKDSGNLTISEEDLNKKIQGYKCVLNSKATEESMCNFARWEPTHGRFNFGHPWKQYLKIGASLRRCAYCIETLNSCVGSDIEAPPCIRKHLSDKCLKVSSYSTNVLKELAITIMKMKKSSRIEFRVAEMNFAVQELRDALKSLPSHLLAPPSSTGEESTEAKSVPIKKADVLPPIMKVLPLITVVSLLEEIAARIGGVADAVEELASLAEFKPAKDRKPKQNLPTNKIISDNLNRQTI